MSCDLDKHQTDCDKLQVSQIHLMVGPNSGVIRWKLINRVDGRGDCTPGGGQWGTRILVLYICTAGETQKKAVF